MKHATNRPKRPNAEARYWKTAALAALPLILLAALIYNRLPTITGWDIIGLTALPLALAICITAAATAHAAERPTETKDRNTHADAP